LDWLYYWSDNNFNIARMIIPKRTKCQIWARVVGFLRPVDKWNEGKKAEFEDRKMFGVKNK